jgi:hypothetical protein
MKKLLNVMMAAAVTTTVLFISCSKNDSERVPVTTSTAKAGSSLRLGSSSCARIDFSAGNLGDMHNNLIMDVLQGYDHRNPLSVNEIRERLYAHSFDVSPLGFNSYTEFVDRVFEENAQLSRHGYDLRNWPDHPVMQSDAGPYVRQVLDAVDAITTVDALKRDLEIIEADAVQRLDCQDLDLVLGAIKVAKSSAYLWAPASWGGMGYLETLNIQERALAQHRSLKSIIVGAIKGDIGSSFTYFSGLGIAAVIGGSMAPGTNLAILGGWAISAGLGSIGGATGLF